MNNMKYIFVLILGLFLLPAIDSPAKTKIVKAEISNRRLSETPVSKHIFGNFVEAGFGRQVSGMWSEMIYNRSFMLPGSYPKFGDSQTTTQWWMFPVSMYNSNAPFWHSGYEEMDWETTDPALIKMSRTLGTESFKGISSLQLTKSNNKWAGISQKGIYIQAGREYTFYLLGGTQTVFPKNENLTTSFEIILREEANPANILFRKQFVLKGYQEYHTCDIPDLNYTGRVILEMGYEQYGNVVLSCCSMMPKDNVHGWRKDVVELLKAVNVPVIRYPGGCYASFYNWRNYVGQRDTRETSTSYYWGGLDDNDASIDEFLQLCDEVGCEPQICINMMTGTPFKAAELVEYLNGGENTAMGRFRRENGVTRNRKVRLFEMDNEAGRKWTALQYAEQVVDYAQAMRAIDPDIQIMMMTYSFNEEKDYFEQMLQIAGKHIDFVIHRDYSPRFVNQTLTTLRKYNEANGTNIKLTNTEWLADSQSPAPFTDKEIPQQFWWDAQMQDSYKKVLSFRQIHWFYALNGAANLLDYLSYGGEFFLANFNNCVNTWGQNIIEASKEVAWLSPMGEVFRFFAKRDDLYPLQSLLPDKQSETTQDKNNAKVFNDTNVEFPLMVNRQSQTAFFKITACETNEGINIYFVNKSTDPVRLQPVLPKGYHPVKIEELYAPNRLSRTYYDHSDVKTEARTLKNQKIVEIRPLSISRIKCIGNNK
ncbi:MAG: hypothetical protein LBT49_05375 [Prevotellaceae bacterium]|jgi:hypothetical protein|nr:hypothetical protein [Prevotellaceae bacterium]